MLVLSGAVSWVRLTLRISAQVAKRSVRQTVSWVMDLGVM